MMNRILRKVVVIGRSHSGKTDLVYQILEMSGNASSARLNPMDFYSRTFEVADAEVKMVVWDLAGEERFTMVRRSCYNGTQAALIVFDQNDPLAREDIRTWNCEIAEDGPIPAILLVQNKLNNQPGAGELAEELKASGNHLIEVDISTGDGIASVREWLLETADAKAQPVQ
jgi:small GTP-binding protein